MPAKCASSLHRDAGGLNHHIVHHHIFIIVQTPNAGRSDAAGVA
jgi:hypothetical protein